MSSRYKIHVVINSLENTTVYRQKRFLQEFLLVWLLYWLKNIAFFWYSQYRLMEEAFLIRIHNLTVLCLLLSNEVCLLNLNIAHEFTDQLRQQFDYLQVRVLIAPSRQSTSESVTVNQSDSLTDWRTVAKMTHPNRLRIP